MTRGRDSMRLNSLVAQLAPLELDPSTNEPFLRLPAPHTNIILTPGRTSDAEALVPTMNDFRVYDGLLSAPHPYTLAYASAFVARVSAAHKQGLDELHAAASSGNATPALTSACPVFAIRERRADGSDVLVGMCGIHRSGFTEVLDTEERTRLTNENGTRTVGDPDIVWSFGDHVAVEYHGKGIMTAVIHAIIYQWAVPRMGARKIVVTAFKGNMGSVRTFEKNGFVLTKTLENCVEIKAEGRTGQPKRGLHVLEWNASS